MKLKMRRKKCMEFDVNKIDYKLLQELSLKIILIESQNLSRKSRSDVQMVKEIKKLIEERVKCEYRV